LVNESLYFASCIDGKSLGLNELCRLNTFIVVGLKSSERIEPLRTNASELLPFGRGRSVRLVF